MNEEFIEDNHIDDHVDEEIINCFNKENEKSFFMFAGAGSGKTRSLVKMSEYIDATILTAEGLKDTQER